MISPCAQTQYNNRSLFVVSESALTHPETYSSWSITASFCSSSCNCSEQWHLSEQSINSLPLEFNPFKKASKLKAFPAWCANTRGFVIQYMREGLCVAHVLPSLYFTIITVLSILLNTLLITPQKTCLLLYSTTPISSKSFTSSTPQHNAYL